MKNREGLQAVEKQHSALVESKTLHSQRRKDFDTEVEAGAKINRELEEEVRVKMQAVFEGKFHLETKSLEVDKKKSLLEALMTKEEADTDAGKRKISAVILAAMDCY